MFKKHISNIKDLADGVEKNYNARIEYDEATLSTYEKEYVENNKKARAIKKEVRNLNSQAKTFTDAANQIIEKIELGFEDKVMDLFYIDDEDNNVREYYDSEGNFILDRKLKSSEKANILKFSKAVNE
jgi:predicted RNase H-like HicB family nuclease